MSPASSRGGWSLTNTGGAGRARPSLPGARSEPGAPRRPPGGASPAAPPRPPRPARPPRAGCVRTRTRVHGLLGHRDEDVRDQAAVASAAAAPAVAAVRRRLRRGPARWRRRSCARRARRRLPGRRGPRRRRRRRRRRARRRRARSGGPASSRIVISAVLAAPPVRPRRPFSPALPWPPSPPSAVPAGGVATSLRPRNVGSVRAGIPSAPSRPPAPSAPRGPCSGPSAGSTENGVGRTARCGASSSRGSQTSRWTTRPSRLPRTTTQPVRAIRSSPTLTRLATSSRSSRPQCSPRTLRSHTSSVPDVALQHAERPHREREVLRGVLEVARVERAVRVRVGLDPVVDALAQAPPHLDHRVEVHAPAPRALGGRGRRQPPQPADRRDRRVGHDLGASLELGQIVAEGCGATREFGGRDGAGRGEVRWHGGCSAPRSRTRDRSRSPRTRATRRR